MAAWRRGRGVAEPKEPKEHKEPKTTQATQLYMSDVWTLLIEDRDELNQLKTLIIAPVCRQFRVLVVGDGQKTTCKISISMETQHRYSNYIVNCINNDDRPKWLRISNVHTLKILQLMKKLSRCPHATPLDIDVFRDVVEPIVSCNTTANSDCEFPFHDHQCSCESEEMPWLDKVPWGLMSEKDARTLCQIVVRSVGCEIRHVPQSFRSELFASAVCSCPFALQHLKWGEELKEDEERRLAIVAVSHYAGALDFVPKPQHTFELWAHAMRGDNAPHRMFDDFLQYIDPEICPCDTNRKKVLLAIANAYGTSNAGNILNADQYLGMETADVHAVITKPFVIKLVKAGGLGCLESLPEHAKHLERDPDVICAALQCDGCQLRHVKDPTEQQCMDAIIQTSVAIKHVPVEFLHTDEMYLRAVECGGKHMHVLSLIPEHRRSEEICKTAIDCNPDQIQYVPPSLASSEMWDRAIMWNPRNAQYKPLWNLAKPNKRKHAHLDSA